MTKYVALLRGINVGGHNKIAMNDLQELFTTLGCKEVKTYLQTGNVVFYSKKGQVEKFASDISHQIEIRFNCDVEVIVRLHSDVQKLVEENPFGRTKADKSAKEYVVFLKNQPSNCPDCPFWSPQRNIEIIQFQDSIALCRLYPTKDGQYPNEFIEKTFKVKATTRNWNTVEKIASDRR